MRAILIINDVWLFGDNYQTLARLGFEGDFGNLTLNKYAHIDDFYNFRLENYRAQGVYLGDHFTYSITATLEYEYNDNAKNHENVETFFHTVSANLGEMVKPIIYF